MPVEGDPYAVHLAVDREATCRPGCGVCGKPGKRADRRKLRHGQRAEILDRMD